MKPLVRELLLGALFLALAAVETTITGDLGRSFYAGPDPSQDVWILNWVTGHLVTQPDQIFEGNNFFPAHDAILFSDPLIGPAVLVTPLRLFTRNPILLYNAAILLGLALSSYGFYRLALRISGEAGPALLAGIAIPYTAQQTHHLSHLNLVTTAGYPFLFLCLFALLERPRLGPALGAGLAFAWQAGTSGYHAFSCFFLCLLIAVWAWRDLRRPAVLAHAALAAAVAAVLLLPYVLGFLRLRGEGRLSRPLETAGQYSVDLATGLMQTEAYLWRAWLPSGSLPVFPGFVVVILAIFGAVRTRSPYRRLLLLIAGFFLLVALGPDLRVFGRPVVSLPFRLLFEHAPLFDAVRHPATFAAPAVMALGLLAVLGLRESGLSRRPILLAALLMLAFAETLSPRPLRRPRPTALPEVYRFLQRQPPGALLELPLDDVESAQWWSIFHGMPTFSGMAAFEPDWYEQVYQRIHHEWSRPPAHQNMEEWISLQTLKTNVPVRYLVLHPGGSGYTRTHLEATPETFEPLREFPDGDAVYRVHRGGKGRLLRRGFRDDQLDARQVWAVLRGQEGAGLLASFNDVPLERIRLTPGWGRTVFQLPVGGVKRGLNLLTLELQGEGVFELKDVDTPG